MRKSRILGCALTLAATLVVGGAMGQKVQGGANFVEIKAGDANDMAALVQINKSYGFYALPDLAYHPKYNSTDNWGLTADFTWDWTKITDIAFTKPDATRANYVEIEASKVGEYTIEVKEKVPSTWGVCDGSSSTFKLYAFDAPSIVKGITDSKDANVADAGKKYCGAAKDVKVFFEALSSGTPHFKYSIKKLEGEINKTTGVPSVKAGGKEEDALTTTTIDATALTGINWTWDAKTTDLKDFPAAGTNGVAIKVLEPLTTGAAPKLAKYAIGLQHSFTAPAAGDGIVTVYRFILSDINGLISRNGDRDKDGAATTETFYATADKYVDVFVVKPPTTGPVYHIGNNTAK